MPDETIDAFADHGVIRENAVETDLEKARQTLRDLENVGWIWTMSPGNCRTKGHSSSTPTMP